MHMGTWTPWGTSDFAEQITRGIMQYGAPGHGGFHLSPTQNAKVHPTWRQGNKQASLRAEGWYEEDVDWAIVAKTFPHLFTNDQRADAELKLKNYYPHQYMETTGETLTPAESRVLTEEHHESSHINDWLARSAWGDWHEAVPDGQVGVLATRRGQQQCFLVPEDEYDARGSLPFVVDTDRHLEVPSFF